MEDLALQHYATPQGGAWQGVRGSRTCVRSWEGALLSCSAHCHTFAWKFIAQSSEMSSQQRCKPCYSYDEN